jgi:AcrR family transcriptional regulator
VPPALIRLPAGLTKGAVYSNFASKQDLLLALVERRSSQQSGPAQIIADESVALDERFAALGRGYAECLQAPRDRDFILLTIELWLAAMRDPGLRTGYAEAIRGIRHAIAEVIERQFGRPHQT